LQAITSAIGSKKTFDDNRLKSVLQALEARIGELISSGKARTYSLQDVLDLANHNAALLAISDEILRLSQIVPDLSLTGRSSATRSSSPVSLAKDKPKPAP
jgi:hypothetical protein